MANEKENLISFNVNWLLNSIKQSKILTQMKKEQAHVLYLQDTHLNDKQHENEREWASPICFLFI